MSPSQRYVYGSYVDGVILKDGQLTDIAGNTDSGILYYHRNQQYSIVALTNGAADVVERYAYTAYGETTIMDANGNEIEESEFANPYTYTARRSDDELGLLYFRARYYDASLGEFISRDPLGFVDGMSQYRAYFVPNGTDPSGKSWGGCIVLMACLPARWAVCKCLCTNDHWDVPGESHSSCMGKCMAAKIAEHSLQGKAANGICVGAFFHCFGKIISKAGKLVDGAKPPTSWGETAVRGERSLVR